MYDFILKIALFIILTLSLQAETGLTQTHLVSLYPEVSAQAISADSIIEIEFDTKIIKSSVKNNTIILKSNGKKIKGKTTIKNSTTLVFTPKEILKTASYKVKVKKVKLQDKANKKIYKDKNGVVYQVCSYLCDDIDDCMLPKCGKKAIKTKKIKYDFSVDANTLHITNIKLDKQTINLNNDDTTTIKVTATYSDNSTKDLTQKIEWIINNNSIISIDKNIIIPNKEGTTSLQARYNNQTTKEIKVTVYKEINGYRLPPEPDPTINNSTLLGIDSNDNGVRDDVERKVIETYREPIKIELMMDYSQVAQIVLENPVGLAIEHQQKFRKISNCKMYLIRQGIKLGSTVDFFENNTYNTKQRVRAYLDYNIALSGGVYGSRPADWNAQACDFDVEQMIKDMK